MTIPEHVAVLHLFFGKIASGKSTLAAELAAAPGTVLISEDAWLASLYPGEIASLEDHSRYSRRLEVAMAPHLVRLLAAGLDVVLDFHANTRRRRDWARTVADASRAETRLHLIDVPDELCKTRLRARNAARTHVYQVSEAMFARFSAHLEPPRPDEGWTIVSHPQERAGLR